MVESEQNVGWTKGRIGKRSKVDKRYKQNFESDLKVVMTKG